jgi:cysteine desulfurase/selenocysteine lyase
MPETAGMNATYTSKSPMRMGRSVSSPEVTPAQARAMPGMTGAAIDAVSPYFIHETLEAPYLLEEPGAGLGRELSADFPALHQNVNGHRLVWLDNAATTQKPQAVVDRLVRFYEKENSNVHRAAHTLAAKATEAYEEARAHAAAFLGARQSSEVVFVRGTTEAINLVAHSAGQHLVSEGDEIIVSELEHHSNIVPWQLLCQRAGAVIRVLPVDDEGNLQIQRLEELLGPRTRLLAVTHVSNTIGTIVPLSPIVEMAHRHGVYVVVDGAQAAAHLPVDVTALDVDFYAFSGHKVLGPTGIGVLYGKKHLLDAMPPWQGGGSMIDEVRFERTTYAPVPAKFEAGTGHIAGAVGLSAALDYIEQVDRSVIAAYEHGLMDLLLTTLREVPDLHIVGNPPMRAGSVPFVIGGIEPEAVAAHLDRDGIAVRAGHHCAQPVLRRFGFTGVVRASLALYNTPDDIQALGASLHRLVRSRG